MGNQYLDFMKSPWLQVMTSSAMLLLAIASFLCSQVVFARYCNPEIDHESPSGDYVRFSIDNRENRIRVRANGHNWFGWIGRKVVVRGFKGDGYGYSNNWPTIRSSTVHKSLFSPAALPAVFDGMDKDKMELALSARRESERNEERDPFIEIKKLVLHYFDMLPKMKLVVKDADKPISIGNRDHVYFWGAGRLPSRIEECANYTTSNDGRNVSFCKHEDMEQCAAKISVFPHLAPFSLETPQGERLTQFAWLCKAGSVCCAWECCERYPRDPGDMVIGFCFLMMPTLIIVSHVLRCRDRRRLAAEAKAKTDAEELLQSPYQLPTITSDESTTILGTTTEKLDHGAIIDIRAFVMNNS